MNKRDELAITLMEKLDKKYNEKTECFEVIEMIF